MGLETKDWIEDCVRWRGTVLRGFYAHWCHDWDCLPVDENTPEMDCCCCFDEVLKDFRKGEVNIFFNFDPFYSGA